MIGRTISHYRIVEKLGGGGMGVVYKAEDTRLGRPVAMKFLPENLCAEEQAILRFEREARTASSLNHPHICTIHDIGDVEGQHFIVMEHLDGRTLKQFIAGRRCPNEEIIRLGTQIADALSAAHAQGIVHHDVKPSNVFVTSRGDVKILDFGLATLPRPELDLERDETASSDDLAPGAGTLLYMAPEQLSGERCDSRADIYALGATLYEMATGRAPFREKSTARLIDAILHQAPAPPASRNPELPRELEEIILKCMEKDRERRYQSALEVIMDLKRAASVQAAGKSLAVLYFDNLSALKEDEYFRDGMTEDIITQLSKVKTLRVFPRSAAVGYRNKSADAAAVGRRVGASHVLSGTLRRVGNHLRITAQLVDTRSGLAAWAEKYDREMKDIFELQDEIAGSISEALRITLSPQEEQALARRPTGSPQAYDYYLRGRSFARRCTRSDLELAIEMYGHAIALDPRFALAHAGMSIAYGLLYDWHEKDPRWISLAVEACERAKALEPELAEALAAYARLRWSQRNFEEAIRYALEAIRHKPDCENAYWTLGQAYFASDRWKEAAALAERAVEMAGADYNVFVPYEMVFERLGDHAAARNLRRRHIEALQHHLELVPEDIRARILLANNYAFLGSEAGATRQLEMAIELCPHDSNILYNAACTFGILQKKREALAALKKAIVAGFVAFDYAVRDPDLACLHGDKDFEDLMTVRARRR